MTACAANGPQTAPASGYSCDSEKFYAEYLKEKAAAGVPDPPALPEDPQSAPHSVLNPCAAPPAVLTSSASDAISADRSASPSELGTQDSELSFPDPSFDPDSPTTMTKEDYDRFCPRPDPNPPDPDKPLNPFTHPADYLFTLTHGYRRDNPPETHPRPPLGRRLRQPQKIPRRLLIDNWKPNRPLTQPPKTPLIMRPLSLIPFSLSFPVPFSRLSSWFP